MTQEDINVQGVKERAISEILSNKQMSLIIDNEEYPREQLQEDINNLSSLSLDELKKRWEERIGRWLATRQNMPQEQGVDFDTWLDEQWSRIVSGDKREYGFQYQIEVNL